jgi:hypothetical protein
MARLFFLASVLAVAAAFQALAMSKMPASRMPAPARTAVVSMEEGGKSVTIGAAAVGGVLGIYFFHELSTGVILAALFAYGSTLSNSFGSATKTAGRLATVASTAHRVLQTLRLRRAHQTAAPMPASIRTPAWHACESVCNSSGCRHRHGVAAASARSGVVSAGPRLRQRVLTINPSKGCSGKLTILQGELAPCILAHYIHIYKPGFRSLDPINEPL